MSSKGIAGFNAGLVRSVTDGYTPTEWATGDIITADKLNHIEEGVVNSSAFVINITTSTQSGISADKTYDEILDAINNGKHVYLKEHNESSSDGSFIIYNLYQMTSTQISFNHTIYDELSRDLTGIEVTSIIFTSEGTVTSTYASKNFT